MLHGRKNDMIVLPNGLNVFPEDIENALRVAGIRDSVVLETEPGRIEAIVLAPASPTARAVGRHGRPGRRSIQAGADLAGIRADVDAAVKAANATLAVNRGSRPGGSGRRSTSRARTRMKVKRNEVRAWAAVAAPLPVTDAP